MIPRPNAIMLVMPVKDVPYVFVYVRDGVNHYWGPFDQKYFKTTDPCNLDPFVNWLDFPPDHEWVHPVITHRMTGLGWMFKAYDTYHRVFWDDKPTTLKALTDAGNLFLFFDKILDTYNIPDDELLKELNVGRIEPWTVEELERL